MYCCRYRVKAAAKSYISCICNVMGLFVSARILKSYRIKCSYAGGDAERRKTVCRTTSDVVAGDAVLRAFFIINPFHFIYFIYGKTSSHIDRGTITLSLLGMRGIERCAGGVWG